MTDQKITVYNSGACGTSTEVLTNYSVGSAATNYSYSGYNGSIYSFKVSSTDGTTTLLSDCVPTPMQIQALNIEVPIEMAYSNLWVPAGTTAYEFQSMKVDLDPSYYDGTSISFNFEIVVKNFSTSYTGEVELLRNGASIGAGVKITALTTDSTFTIKRAIQSFTPPVGSGTYTVKLTAGADFPLEVSAARIIVRQTGATKTRIHVPLISYKYSLTSTPSTETDSLENVISATSSTTYGDGLTYFGSLPGQQVLVNWKMPTIDAATSIVELNAIIRSSAGTKAAKAALCRVNTTEIISGVDTMDSMPATPVCFGEISYIPNNTSTPVLERSLQKATVYSTTSRNGLNTYFGANTFYRAQIATVNGASTYLHHTWLWITLTGVDSVSTYHQIVRNKGVGSPITFEQQRLDFNNPISPAPNYYHEGCMSVGSAGSVTSSIAFDGANTSGTAGSPVGIDLVFNSSALTCRSTGPTTLGSGYLYGRHGAVEPTGTYTTHGFIRSAYSVP